MNLTFLEVEIYEPDSTDTVWMSFSTDVPFYSFQKGDYINPLIRPGLMFQVTSVEHIIWTINNDEVREKMCVYTKKIEVTRETLLDQPSTARQK